MVLRSNRPPTALAGRLPSKAPAKTIKDFLTLLQSRGVDRVTYGNIYRVYGDGIFMYGKPAVVVKVAKLALRQAEAPKGRKETSLAASIYKELLILTDHRLKSHPNLVRLVWHDVVDAPGGLQRPALIMERAVHGTLTDFLQSNASSLGSKQRLSLVADVASGLQALHRCGIVHGDVKPDNILIFPASTKGTYVAKISDLGSSISVLEPSGLELARYYGTPIFNAPEVFLQDGGRKLDVVGLKRCDIYSFGLLAVCTVLGDLPKDLTGCSSDIQQLAISQLGASSLSEVEKTSLVEVLKSTLEHDAAERCADLAVVCGLLGKPVPSSGAERKATDEFTKRDPAIAAAEVFGDAEYLRYQCADEIFTTRAAQNELLESFQRDSESPKGLVAMRALFQLGIAHGIGFGTPNDLNAMLDYVVRSARKGYLPARASIGPWLQYHGQLGLVDRQELTEWLFEATAWGSINAATCLRRLDKDEYVVARDEFHQNGGYNQYFFPAMPPPGVHSPEYLQALMQDIIKLSPREVTALGLSAAVYGDHELLGLLFDRFQLDPDTTNEFGESLLVLACKCGSLTTCQVLVEGGAATKSGANDETQSRESPLHWLIAFDEEDMEAAAILLAQTRETEIPADLSWNHPVIDLPGHMPLGGPLHLAIWADSPRAIELMLDHFNIQLSYTGSSEVPPLNLAVLYRRQRVLESLTRVSSASDIRIDILHDLCQNLEHEDWLAAAQAGTNSPTLVDLCLGAILTLRPEALDGETEEGFTPIMTASMHHDRTVVQALITRGANVNHQTPEQFDGRTAGNLLTENRLQTTRSADLLKLLLDAGADLGARSKPGGKQLLQFAARDDCLALAEALLDNPQVDIEDTSIPYGLTALHTAAQFRSHAVSRLLLERGANPSPVHLKGTLNDWDWSGLTPVAIAALKLDPTGLKLLVDHGATLSACPQTGSNVIHLASLQRSSDMLKMLLELPECSNTSTVDALNANGDTGLHLCTANPFQRHEHIRLLVAARASPNIPCATGHSALDILVARRDDLSTVLGSGELASYLSEHDEIRKDGISWFPIAPDNGACATTDTSDNEEVMLHPMTDKDPLDVTVLEVPATDLATQTVDAARKTNWNLNADSFTATDSIAELRLLNESILLLRSAGAVELRPGVPLPAGVGRAEQLRADATSSSFQSP